LKKLITKKGWWSGSSIVTEFKPQGREKSTCKSQKAELTTEIILAYFLLSLSHSLIHLSPELCLLGLQMRVTGAWLLLFFETSSHCVAQAVLKTLLPQPPECWHYRHVSPHWAVIFLFFFLIIDA
jgi:hypothetical protein